LSDNLYTVIIIYTLFTLLHIMAEIYRIS